MQTVRPSGFFWVIAWNCTRLHYLRRAFLFFLFAFAWLQVGTWHSNYCEYIKFYSGASWVVPVLRRYMQQFYGGIPTTFVPTEFMRLKLTDEG